LFIFLIYIVPSHSHEILTFDRLDFTFPTGLPLRNPSNGLCVPCTPNESGLLACQILSFDRGGPKAFKPYVVGRGDSKEEDAAKKKLLHDVWKKGDTVFSTGDVMMADKHGWMFFQVSLDMI
jgi:solute carrier family 27 fatty acid transporter 1/4